MIVVSVSSFPRPFFFFSHETLLCAVCDVSTSTWRTTSTSDAPPALLRVAFFFFFAFRTSTHKTGEKEKNVTNKTVELLKRAERIKNEVRHSR